MNVNYCKKKHGYKNTSPTISLVMALHKTFTSWMSSYHFKTLSNTGTQKVSMPCIHLSPQYILHISTAKLHVKMCANLSFLNRNLSTYQLWRNQIFRAMIQQWQIATCPRNANATVTQLMKTNEYNLLRLLTYFITIHCTAHSISC